MNSKTLKLEDSKTLGIFLRVGPTRPLPEELFAQTGNEEGKFISRVDREIGGR